MLLLLVVAIKSISKCEIKSAYIDYVIAVRQNKLNDWMLALDMVFKKRRVIAR